MIIMLIFIIIAANKGLMLIKEFFLSKSMCKNNFTFTQFLRTRSQKSRIAGIKLK